MPTDLGAAIAGPHPLSRRDYVLAGALLMAGKYVVDAAFIYAMAGVVWTPLDYIIPLVSIGAAKTAAFSGTLSIILLIWTLPFAWLGVTMSVRRARNAGITPWLVVAFFLPILNYLLLLLLALAPPSPRLAASAERPDDETAPDSAATRGTLDWNAIGAAAAGAGVAMGAVVLATLWARTYGLSLFFGAPFMLGLVAGLLANKSGVRSLASTQGVVVLAAAIAAVGMLALALEGAICLVLGFPISVPLAFLGGTVGRSMAEGGHAQRGRAGAAMLLFLMPAGVQIDRAIDAPDVRVVTTMVEVDAPRDAVWHYVVAFDEITEPPSLEFRLGLAYPQRARIEGTGVGAIRYCEFSTGAFVEPITEWDEPSRLAFDVTAQPPPLREWSPWSQIYAPHVDGFFTTTRGEFRLIELPGNRTRLEGRTWYTLRMAPALYWHPVADAIIHRIHDRVLQHIRRAAEAAPDVRS